VICPPRYHAQLKHQGVLVPLRPELDGAEWDHLSTLEGALVNLFRLDGAHFLSANLNVIAPCQRIVDNTIASLFHGTGTNAAQFVSKKIGLEGFVIKVSASGVIKYFLAGRQVESADDLASLIG